MATNPTEADTTRQKRWAPKVRTGCHTCRTRRIKCDETQPRCKKCVRRGLHCQYTLCYRPVARARPLAPAHAPAPLVAQSEPPSWHFMEAIRYYCAFIRPVRVAEQGTHDIQDPPFHTGDAMSARFVCQVIGHQAFGASRRRGRLVSFWGEPQFAAARKTYARYLAEFLDIVNRCLADGATWKAFHYLWNLFDFDLMLNERLWQAHVNGALAYAQLLGGPRAALGLPGPTIFFRQMVLQAIVSNTTSPVARQITGHLAYTDAEIRAVLGDEDSTRPFPADLVVIAKHITDVRVQVAVGSSSTLPTLQARVRSLFRQIDAFDADTWAAELDFYAGADVTPAIGRVFQLATRLYAVLALPVSVTAAADGGMLRTGLLERLRGVWPNMPDTGNMAWPLLVVGVALADGGGETDRAFVKDCLDGLWRGMMSDAAPLLGLEKLRRFWGSGKRGWEDCFDEPVPR